MRLTLRTLLAYLDNTLEPEDVEILRAKLEESGFATQLVHRIRQSLTNRELTAPPPDSVHPIGEANVISEYLDSTLTPEQIAEIERACLESEPHLAEAAACHQILTMVLGQPATASDQLRQRIYSLPEAAQSQPPARSFSSVSIPAEQGTGPEQLPTAAPSMQPAGKTVQPVGKDDSGVFDAPTRLRESAATEGEPLSGPAPAIAGSRRLDHLEVSDVYSGTGRGSLATRILVSLAMAVALAFVLLQIFAPVLNRETAQKQEERIPLNPNAPLGTEETTDERTKTSPVDEPVGKDDAPPETTEVESDEPQPAAAASAESADAETTTPETSSRIASETPAADDGSPDPIPAAEGDDKPDSSPLKSDQVPIAAVEKMLDNDSPAGDTPAPAAPATPATPDPSAKSAVAAAATEGPDPVPMEEGKVAAAPDAPPMGIEAKGPDDPDAASQPNAAAAAQQAAALAKLITEKTLLVAEVDGDKWIRVVKDVGIAEQVKLVNGPGFRSQLNSAAGEMMLTLIGGTQVSLAKDPDGSDVPGVNLVFGRVLLTSKQAAVTTTANLGGYPATISMAQPETVVALEVRYFRPAGKDPSQPDNHLRVARIFSVQGDVELKTDDGDHQLQTGQQWLVRGDEIAPVAAMTDVPAWVDAPDENVASIEAEARAGLLQLLANAEANVLTIYLSEATTFRRAEVGALAAQTLLLMGNGGTYFGSDGILSNPEQRLYWPKHFQGLRAVVDFSPESAAALATSITEMDAADGNTLFRLLVGYSEKQLVEGGDEELIDLLESNSMAVRVLAIENLRAITGTTLYYRAEEDSAGRRVQATKKWRARQRNGDIRWNAEED